jgi:chemotaxis protein methyltransferase CheR
VSIGQDHPAIAALLDDFYERTGIFFNEKRAIVAQRIVDFFMLRGIERPEEFLPRLKQDETLYQALTNLLTVNETYFFREARTVEIFAAKAKEHSGRFGVLCLPSSTGEEAYTLSIALLEAGLSPDRYTIIGGDINSEVVRQAKEGIFGTRSLYRTSEAIRQRYFESMKEGILRVRPEVRSPVGFRQINLFGPDLKRVGPFEFIFCRNLLIYFDQASRTRAEEALYSRLKPGGYLFMGHADLIKNVSGFERHFEQGILYYRRPIGS